MKSYQLKSQNLRVLNFYGWDKDFVKYIDEFLFIYERSTYKNYRLCCKLMYENKRIIKIPDHIEMVKFIALKEHYFICEFLNKNFKSEWPFQTFNSLGKDVLLTHEIGEYFNRNGDPCNIPSMYYTSRSRDICKECGR
jgi:hypothetical protein